MSVGGNHVMRRVPGAPRMLVHPDGGRAAAQLRSLAGASDWRRALLDRVGTVAVTIAGPARLPMAPDGWAWPAVSADELCDHLDDELPGLRLLGAVVPRQRGRERLSLLGRFGASTTVIKLGRSEPGASMRIETAVLRLLERHPLPAIATPRVLAAGEFRTSQGPVEYLATTSIGLGAQRPALDAPLRTFERDLSVRLGSLDVGVDVETDGLVPVHGDLTPWNLRRTANGLALFDWEAAGWGAPGSDIALYRRSCDDVRPWWRRSPATP